MSPATCSAPGSGRRRPASLSTRVLVAEGMVDETALVKALGHHIGVDFISLADTTIDPAAAALIPESLARRYGVIPVRFEDESLIVAMVDPGNVLVVDDVRAITGRRVVARIATRADIEDAIRRQGRYDESVSDLADMVGGDVQEEDLSRVQAAVEEAPIVKLVNTLISRAVNERASDLHIEPGERDLRVRFRIDGVLHEIMTTPRSVSGAVVSPAQDHGRPRHRRAAGPPGRPGQHPGVGQADRSPRGDAALDLRREGGAADPRQGRRHARPRRARLPALLAGAIPESRTPSPMAPSS